MTTATTEKIRSRQERLNASMQTALEMVRQVLLKNGAAIIEARREMEQELRKALREGLEREALLATLAALRPQAESAVELFTRALALCEGDPTSLVTAASQLREEKDFLAWLRDLEARVSAPVPPFDASKLPPDPATPTAEGYVSVSEARARVRSGKQP
ncbi:MAG TPA: hypothetical protein VFE78_19545 [Gemmataceae bacterium]|jgi:hypothetical protein|nr:hypothetical protein [Gemmataceae bacterium]